jgi:hypothetical protein
MTELDHRLLNCAAHSSRLAEVAIAEGANVDAQVRYARTAALHTIPRAGRFSGRPSQVCSRGIWNLHGIHSILSAVKVVHTSGCYSRRAIKISPPLLVNGAKEFDFLWTGHRAVMNLRSRRGRSEPLKNKLSIGPA